MSAEIKPVVKLQMLFRVPVGRVFEAFVDPEVTTRFWFTHSSGRLTAGSDVTTHGFALNVNTDLSYFNWIIACEGEPVTSMDRLLGREVEMCEVEERIIFNFKEVFEYGPVRKAELAFSPAVAAV